MKVVRIKAEIGPEDYCLDSISILLVSMINDSCTVEDIAQVTKLSPSVILQLLSDRQDLIHINNKKKLTLTEKGKLALDLYELKEFFQDKNNLFTFDTKTEYLFYNKTKDKNFSSVSIDHSFSGANTYNKSEVKGFTEYQNNLLSYMQIFY